MGGSEGFGAGLRGLCVWGAGSAPFLPPQDSSGLRLWKRRWFVLVDLCLYYYRGEARGRGWACDRGQGLLRAPGAGSGGTQGVSGAPAIGLELCRVQRGPWGCPPESSPALRQQRAASTRGAPPTWLQDPRPGPQHRQPSFPLHGQSGGGNSKQGATTAAVLQQRLGPQSPVPHMGLGVLWLNKCWGEDGGIQAHCWLIAPPGRAPWDAELRAGG